MPDPKPMEETLKYLSSLKEDFIGNIIGWWILLVIAILLIYYFYIRNLESRECSFMGNIYSKVNGNLRSINSADPDCGYTFKDYYIKTAYNSCSGGSYKNDFVSLCNLKDVIRQGARGLDFEIYSMGDKPVVATSTEDSYFIKETYNAVDFADVMYTIKQYAFSNSTCPNPLDPIIIHLRIKSTNQQMYSNLAALLSQYDSDLLGKEYSCEKLRTNLGDVKLMEFVNKMVIIVDKSNTSFMENPSCNKLICDKDSSGETAQNCFVEYVNMTSNSMFMRALHFYDVKFSPDMNELQEFNKKNMTIVFPDKGANPPNINAILTRETGCQMNAMRYQLVDQYLEEDAVFFDRAGYAFVLKPERLRYIPVTIPDAVPQKPELSYATREITADYYSFNM